MEDVQTSDQRGVARVGDLHSLQFIQRGVDSVEHDLGSVRHHLRIAPSVCTHVPHHHVVDRAIDVQLPLLLHPPHDLLPFLLVALPLTSPAHPYQCELFCQRVQLIVSPVVPVQASVGSSVGAQESVEVGHDAVDRGVLGVGVVVLHALSWKEHQGGDAGDAELVAEIVHQRAVHAVEVDAGLHLAMSETGKRNGERLGGLLHLDREVVARALEGRHDLDQMRLAGVAAHRIERRLAVVHNVALLGDLPCRLCHEIRLRERQKQQVPETACPDTARNELLPW